MSDFKQIQVRRDVSSDWTAINPVLALGEPGLETDTLKLKFGDGVTAWNSLPYLTQGVKGDKGDRGYTGSDGLKGSPGNDGAPGATGQTGLPGSVGATGAKGDKGDTGTTGQNGTNGAKGEKGDTGDTGATGATGSPGLTGSQGQQGIQGDQGIQGEQGDPGEGLPVGGTTGQQLVKLSDTDYDYDWETPAGAGDMLASVYDPQNIADDAFDQDNMTNGTTNKNYTATEKTKLAGVETAADVTDATNVGAAGAFMKSVDDTDDITVGATNKFATAAEKTKLGHITVTQAVDLDTIETNANNVPGIKTKTDFIAVTQAVDLDQMETDIAALANGMVYKGNWDASAGTFPGAGAAQAGWFYYVSVAGTVDGVAFTVGDNVVAIVDNASATVYASNWSKHDQTDAVQSVAGKVGAVTLVAADLTDVTASAVELNYTDGVTSPIQTQLNAKQPLDADLTALAAAGNSTVLAATTASFLTADETKLDGIEALADVTDAANIASSIVGVAGKTTPVDADTIPLIDSAASNALKELTIANLKLAVGAAMYPVGSIYTSINSTNPATSLGFGTWSAFGAGRVPVGFDSGQTEFDTDEETGGAKTHTLTIGEIPSHNHTYTRFGGQFNYTGGANANVWHDSSTQNTGNAGGGGAHNNLQPYIVVRMWKRTA